MNTQEEVRPLDIDYIQRISSIGWMNGTISPAGAIRVPDSSERFFFLSKTEAAGFDVVLESPPTASWDETGYFLAKLRK